MISTPMWMAFWNPSERRKSPPISKATPTWPGASPLFGSTFFGITGLHMFHVLTGVIYLGVVAARIKKLNDDVEVAGLYWHFVDLVWMFVFPLIYLLSVDYNHVIKP